MAFVSSGGTRLPKLLYQVLVIIKALNGKKISHRLQNRSIAKETGYVLIFPRISSTSIECVDN